MTGYVVTEGEADAIVLRTIVAMAGLDDIRVLDGGGRSAAKSLGTSLALSRRRPVVVVVDADTSSESSIEEQLTIFNDLQLGALPGEECKLLLARPTLEDELFPDAEAFSSAFDLTLDDQQRRDFKKNWAKVVEAFVPKPAGEIAVIPNSGKDRKQSTQLFDRRLVRDFLTFLRAAGHRPEAGGHTRIRRAETASL